MGKVAETRTKNILFIAISRFMTQLVFATEFVASPAVGDKVSLSVHTIVGSCSDRLSLKLDSFCRELSILRRDPTTKSIARRFVQRQAEPSRELALQRSS